MKIKMWLILVLVVVSPGLTSCAGTQFGRSAADVLVPVSDENQLGNQMEPQIADELKFSQNQELQSYIKGLGQKIVAQAEERGDVPRGIDFEFTVVDAPDTMNAFAIPGGHIYIFSGLLKAAESEAEIMGVLGHEVAHVTKRHVAQQLVAMYGLEAVTAMALGKDAGTLSKLVSNVATQGFMLKHSREAERDADYHGLNYMVWAGYNPRGFVSFFEKLGGAGAPPEFLSTHPNPDDRAAKVRSRIRAMDNAPDYLGKQEWKSKRASFGL